jgi:hypothetical protein
MSADCLAECCQDDNRQLVRHPAECSRLATRSDSAVRSARPVAGRSWSCCTDSVSRQARLASLDAVEVGCPAARRHRTAARTLRFGASGLRVKHRAAACQIFGHRHVVMVLIVALVPVLIVYSSSIARDPRWGALSTRRQLSVWTDDFSNLFTVLKWHFSSAWRPSATTRRPAQRHRDAAAARGAGRGRGSGL